VGGCAPAGNATIFAPGGHLMERAGFAEHAKAPQRRPMIAAPNSAAGSRACGCSHRALKARYNLAHLCSPVQKGRRQAAAAINATSGREMVAIR
jgi:hypothetical protein